MRTLYIDLSADQTSVPKLFGGYEGEHNETQVKVKLPSRLLPAAGVAQYRFNYETADGRNVYSSEISPSELGGDNHDEVTTLLTQTVTLAPTLNFCVCGFAYDEQDPPKATLIGKSQAVSLIIRDPVAGSLDGTETDPIAPGPGSGITVDDELSTTSTNPVQNKIIAEALEDLVDKTYYATTGRLGLVQFQSNRGLAADSGKIYLASANRTAIEARRSIGGSGWGAITPTNIDFLPEALGLPASQVGSTAPTTSTVGKVGDLYVYKPTDENTATVYVCVAVDETQNPAVYTWVPASDLTNYVKKTDIATTNRVGVVKAANPSRYGVEIRSSGEVWLAFATPDAIKAQNTRTDSGWGAITPNNIKYLPEALGLATVSEVDTPPHTGTNASTDPGTVGRFGDIQVYILFAESSGHQSFEGAYLCVGKLYDPNKGGAVYTWAQIA